MKDEKKKTVYDLNKDKYILVNNFKINVNVNIGHNVKRVKSYNNLNQYFNSLNKNNYYFPNNKNLNLPQMNMNNNSFRILNNKSNILNNNNNLNNEQFHKKFFTTSIPQGTNMQAEMLLYELNQSLSKTEKIDYSLYIQL